MMSPDAFASRVRVSPRTRDDISESGPPRGCFAAAKRSASAPLQDVCPADMTTAHSPMSLHPNATRPPLVCSSPWPSW